MSLHRVTQTLTFYSFQLWNSMSENKVCSHAWNELNNWIELNCLAEKNGREEGGGSSLPARPPATRWPTWPLTICTLTGGVDFFLKSANFFEVNSFLLLGCPLYVSWNNPPVLLNFPLFLIYNKSSKLEGLKYLTSCYFQTEGEVLNVPLIWRNFKCWEKNCFCRFFL